MWRDLYNNWTKFSCAAAWFGRYHPHIAVRQYPHNLGMQHDSKYENMTGRICWSISWLCIWGGGCSLRIPLRHRRLVNCKHRWHLLQNAICFFSSLMTSAWCSKYWNMAGRICWSARIFLKSIKLVARSPCSLSAALSGLAWPGQLWAQQLYQTWHLLVEQHPGYLAERPHTVWSLVFASASEEMVAVEGYCFIVDIWWNSGHHCRLSRNAICPFFSLTTLAWCRLKITNNCIESSSKESAMVEQKWYHTYYHVTTWYNYIQPPVKLILNINMVVMQN